MSPVVEVPQEVTFSPIWSLTRWRGAGKCEQWSAGWISTSDRKGEGRMFLGTHCHSKPPILSIIPLLTSSVIAALCPSLWSLCERRDFKRGWMRHGNGIQSACLFVRVLVCLCTPVYLSPIMFRSLPLLQCLTVEPKDSPGTDAAEHPGGWIEPCRLGFYQYIPSRQPGRQEMEQLTYSAY